MNTDNSVHQPSPPSREARAYVSESQILNGRCRLRLLAAIDETEGRRAALSRQNDEIARQRVQACDALLQRLRRILSRQ